MVESIYFLKPAWCGHHLAGLRLEIGLTARYCSHRLPGGGLSVVVHALLERRRAGCEPFRFGFQVGARVLVLVRLNIQGVRPVALLDELRCTARITCASLVER